MLALTEILEILVPLAYTMTFVLAYFGPNSEILGNIGNDYWQYKAIENPTKILSTIFQMFCFDTASAIIGGLLLWNFADVNLWKEFNRVLTTFWPLIALRIAQITSKVRSLSSKRIFVTLYIPISIQIYSLLYIIHRYIVFIVLQQSFDQLWMGFYFSIQLDYKRGRT